MTSPHLGSVDADGEGLILVELKLSIDGHHRLSASPLSGR